MINTILNGFFSIVITLTNWFLTPIYNLIDDIDVGGFTIGDTLSLLTSYLNTIKGGIVWIASATGLPSWMFNILGLFMFANISLRLGIYVIKLILKWYRKLMP